VEEIGLQQQFLDVTIVLAWPRKDVMGGWYQISIASKRND